MKAIRLFLIISIIGLATIISFAQSPPHPNGGNAPGETNTPVGGGAPIGGGIFLLASMGMAYGLKKWKTGRNTE